MLSKKDLVVAGLALLQGSLASLQIVRVSLISKYDSRICLANIVRSLLRRGQQLVQTNTSRLMAEVCM
jgi:hypothetical protein